MTKSKEDLEKIYNGMHKESNLCDMIIGIILIVVIIVVIFSLFF